MFQYYYIFNPLQWQSLIFFLLKMAYLIPFHNGIFGAILTQCISVL